MSLPPSCRILVISSDLSQSHNLIEKILRHDQSEVSDDAYAPLDASEDDGDGESIFEWMISNKYYTAPIHFLAKTISLPPAKPLWPPDEEDDKVPAIIFVFADGEHYRQRFLSMKEGLDAHNAEVTIAARVQLPGEAASEDEEDGEAISEFFSEHGFEFVDVDKSTLPDNQDSDQIGGVIEGIPRIVGALHTIMWPSLVRKDAKPRTHHTARTSEGYDDEEEELTSEDESSALPANVSNLDIFGARQSLFESLDAGLQERDLEALEAWLDGDADSAWKGYPSQASSAAARHEKGSSTALGFDDDFAEFVTATPAAPSDPPINSSASVEVPFASGHTTLEPDTLPSQAEIESTARRIFGSGGPKPSSIPDGRSEDPIFGPIPPASAAGDEPFDFDLSQVLGALQSMKEEVAGIKDLDARRKAAARIAMGFAAGLGLGGGDVLDEELLS